MAFATNSDVAAYFPQTPAFTSTTNVTDATVDQWLTEDAAILRGTLSQIVDFTNLTSEGDEILKQVNAKMSGCKVDGALPHVNAKTQSEEKNKRNLCEEAKKMIKAILAGRLKVSDPCNDAQNEIINSQKPYPDNKFDKDTRY